MKDLSKVLDSTYLAEAVSGFTPRTAMEEAARCLLCHDAPCSKGCPAGTDPGKFIRSIRFRNVKGAAETIRENNILGGSCARVCPYDRLCEEYCSRCGIDRPIQIGKLQRFAIEQEKLFGMNILESSADKKSKKVACIGGGPASLAVAAKLAQEGYAVTIYEANAKAGGMCSYGITPARLPQEVIDHDIAQVEKLGVKFIYNTKVGKDIKFDDIKKDFDAVFVGVGLWAPKVPNIPGKDLKGVYSAVDYLKSARESDGKSNIGKKVIVIGGGDVAMDCASTAKLLGAEVAIWYRRTIGEAPANMAEIQYVTELGVPMTNNFAPKEIVGNAKGEVEYMVFSGREGHLDGAEAKVTADTVVFAIGQAPEDVAGIAPVKVNEKGGIVVENNCVTNIDGVFACGDITNGGKTVVEAVAAGKVAAFEIASYLEAKEGK